MSDKPTYIPSAKDLKAAKQFRKNYLKGLNPMQKEMFKKFAEEKKLLPNAKIVYKGVEMDKDFCRRFMEESGYELARVLKKWQDKKIEEYINVQNRT